MNKQTKMFGVLADRRIELHEASPEVLALAKLANPNAKNLSPLMKEMAKWYLTLTIAREMDWNDETMEPARRAGLYSIFILTALFFTRYRELIGVRGELAEKERTIFETYVRKHLSDLRNMFSSLPPAWDESGALIGILGTLVPQRAWDWVDAGTWPPILDSRGTYPTWKKLIRPGQSHYGIYVEDAHNTDGAAPSQYNALNLAKAEGLEKAATMRNKVNTKRGFILDPVCDWFGLPRKKQLDLLGE